jgi:peroxiredoxin
MRTVVVAALLFAALPAFANSLPIGATAPRSDVKMKSVDGREVSIAGAAGKSGTLVVFTCNHCPYVKAWEQRITALGNDAVARGFGVVAINSNDPAKQPADDFEPMKERAQKLGLKFPYVVDATSGVAKAFGATRTPEVFLFDAAGKLAYKGAVDDNSEDAAKVKEQFLKDALAAVAEGRAPATAETKSIGCTIKWRPEAAGK